MTLIFSLICYSACLFLLLSERKDIVWGKWVFKCLASTSFLMIALTLADVTSPFSNWMIVGFLFCFFGDILLIKSSNKHLFLLGIISFALGHLGFIIAFILSGDVGLVFYATLLLAIILTLGSYLWLKPHLKVEFKIFVPIYILIIGIMLAFSGYAWEGNYRNGVIIGAVLFVCSDLFVAKEKFIGSKFTNKLIGLPLYYTAQIILALSLDW